LTVQTDFETFATHNFDCFT